MYKNLLYANIMHVSFSDGITYDIDLSVSSMKSGMIATKIPWIPVTKFWRVK